MANTQINITENGTTTLATSGCICDRNIDINVNVTVDGGDSGGFNVPDEALTISGDSDYYMCSNKWNWFINMFGDKISTVDITNGVSMFAENNADTFTKVPFDINLKNNENPDIRKMFLNDEYLTEAPYIKGSPSHIVSLFENCKRLRNLPDGFEDYIDLDYIKTQSYAYVNSAFNGCNSLRKIPSKFLSNLYSLGTNGNYVMYQYAFNNCFALDELRDIAVHPATLTQNRFSQTFNNCYRLKDVTFAVQEDGTPITAKWHSQIIDLSTGVGYTNLNTYIIMYNSGIASNKEVKDDATYQALKNDPDWFATKIEYSRYNHDSAVATINSLPDCSAYLATQSGKTNTIKFLGASGSKTDGGAINALTEEEIAVATAKGWTVQFV